MGRLFLQCPTTGRLLDTGTRLPRHVYATYRPKNARSFCRHCHRTHPWSKELMVLEDGNVDLERPPETA